MSYNFLLAWLLTALNILSNFACRCNEPDRTELPADSLLIENIQVQRRDNPEAAWSRVEEGGVLLFNNDCRIRIVARWTMPEHFLKKLIVQTILLERQNQQVVLENKQMPDTLLTIASNKAQAVSDVLFPCFQNAPDWLRPGDPIGLTVIVHYDGRQIRKKFQFIYEVAE